MDVEQAIDTLRNYDSGNAEALEIVLDALEHYINHEKKMEELRAKAKAVNAKWRELEAMGYHSAGCGNDVTKAAIATGNPPHTRIVGYLNLKDLSVEWFDD